MLKTDIPTKMPQIWGAGAAPSFIRTVPIPSQIPIQAGAASFTDGFPPVNFTPVGSGGTPPYGQDFNGLHNAITAWLRWMQAGGWAVQSYDASFALSGTVNVGGYPQGAVLASSTTLGLYWLSTVDSNTTNPDTGGANWVSFTLGGLGNRVITSSAPATLLATDTSVGLNRTAAPAAMNLTLPAVTTAKTIIIRDLAKNFNSFPVTILASVGTTFPGGASSFTLGEDGMSAEFELYATPTNIWGVGILG